MNIGKLDTTVLFQGVTGSVDGMGAPTETWASTANVPIKAEYIPLKGNELISAGKLIEDVKFKLRIRRNTSVTTGSRVTVRSVVYKVLSIQDFGRKNEMILWCGSVG
jgi:SPP1 family predicted phage head-tail adaptor